MKMNETVIHNETRQECVKAVQELIELQVQMEKDIYLLLEYWFSSAESEGADPWECAECITMANRYGFTKVAYKEFLKYI